MPRIVHFEIMSDDPEELAKFYGNVFGWKFNKWQGPVEYWLVTTGTDGPGINGGFMRRMPEAPPVINTLDVPDLERYREKVKSAGGTMVTDKMAVAGVGWFCYFKDPDGNVHGIMQPDESAK
ncbi:MAG: VOC family protein [Gemmatimonadota bacterium]